MGIEKIWMRKSCRLKRVTVRQNLSVYDFIFIPQASNAELV
jgi:hypothetical protein